MNWQAWLTIVAAWIIGDFVLDVVFKKTPLWLSKQVFTAFHRLIKEVLLLHRTLYHDTRFTKWGPKTLEYWALCAIKAHGAGDSKPQSVLDLLESHLKLHRAMVLLGDPGAGKTTVLEALAYRLARRAILQIRWVLIGLILIALLLLFVSPALTSIWLVSFFLWESFVRRAPVPLFLDARKGYKDGAVGGWITEILQETFVDTPLFGWRNRFVFLVDGVNEVSTDVYEKFLDGWAEILRRGRYSQAIFTSRTAQDPSSWLGIESTFSLCVLDNAGVRELLKVYEQRRSEGDAGFYENEQVKRSFGELQRRGFLDQNGIGRNPFWLATLVTSGLNTRNQGRLLHDSTRILIDRETRKKSRYRERQSLWEKIVPNEVEMDALGSLALAMHQEKRTGFAGKNLWSKANAIIRESISDLPFSAYDVLYEAKAATLVRFSQNECVEFTHQLVQNFFTAYALRTPDQWGTVVEYSNDRWWWQTILLLGGIVDDHAAFIRQILGDGSDVERVFLAFGLLDSIEKIDYKDSLQATIRSGQVPEDLDQELMLTVLSQSRAQEQALNKLNQLIGIESSIDKWRSLRFRFEPFTKVEGDVIVALALSLSQGITDIHREILRDLRQITGETVVDRLALLLIPEDIGVKNEIIDLLKGLMEVKAVEYIVLALGDKSVRDTACAALVQMGTLAVEPLIRALVWDREAQLEENGELQDLERNRIKLEKNRLVQLLEAAKDPAVAKALGRQHIRMLQKLLPTYDMIERAYTSQDDFRQTSRPLLEQLSIHQQMGRMRQHFIDSFREVNLPEELIEELVAHLDEYLEAEELLSQRVLNHELIVDILAEIGDSAINMLVQAMNQQTLERHFIRRCAVKVLGKIANEKAIEVLVNELDSDDLAFEARDILKRIGEPAIDALVNALDLDNFRISFGARDVLCSIGQPVIAPLIAALSEGRIGLYWVTLLDEIRCTPEHFDLILSMMLEDKNFSLAGLVVKSIGKPAIEMLIQVLDQEQLSYDSACILRDFVGMAAVEPLVQVLRHSNATVRARALNVLGEIGLIYGFDDNQTINSILEMVQIEENEDIRNQATYALALIGAPVVAFLSELMYEPDCQQYAFAWTSLILMSKIHSTVPKPVITALEDEDSRIRRSAIVCAVVGGDLATILPLVRIIPKESWQMRLLILKSLPNIVFRRFMRIGKRITTKKNRKSYQDELIVRQAIAPIRKLSI